MLLGPIPVLFEVTRTPALLVYNGATAIAVNVWNGVSWQPYKDSTGTAVTLTGAGNLDLPYPGQYQLTGTSLTSAVIYKDTLNG